MIGSTQIAAEFVAAHQDMRPQRQEAYDAKEGAVTLIRDISDRLAEVP